MKNVSPVLYAVTCTLFALAIITNSLSATVLERRVRKLESQASAALKAQKLGAAKLEARQRFEASFERKEIFPACLP